MYFRDIEIGETFTKKDDQQNELWERTEAANGTNCKSLLTGETCFMTLFQQVEQRDTAYYQSALFPSEEPNKGTQV